MYNVSIWYNGHEDVLYTAKTACEARDYVKMLRESCGEDARISWYPAEVQEPKKGKWELRGRIEAGGKLSFIPCRLKDITLPDKPSNCEYYGDWTTREQAIETVVELLLNDEQEAG